MTTPFGRIYLNAYPDPLGFGKSPSRFSDPRRRIAANRFSVLYLGGTGHVNLAVFDRAVSKLAAKRVVPLMGAPGLASVLRDFLVALV